MLMFWVAVGLFLLGALLWVLPSLLQPRLAGLAGGTVDALVRDDQRREVEADLAAGWLDPRRAAEARAELDRRPVPSEVVAGQADGPAEAGATGPLPTRPAWRSAAFVALVVPAASLLLYAQLGRPDAVLPAVASAPREAPAGAAARPVDRHAMTGEQVQQMAAALAERLKAQPADVEGWVMLGRSYTVLSRYRDAATAFRRAIDLQPSNPNLLADLADVIAMAQGKRLAGEPARLIQAALDVDPRHVKALALAGSVAFETRDYAAARGYWERLVAVLPPESPMLRGVRGSLAEAARLEGGGTRDDAAPSSRSAQQAAPAPATTTAPMTAPMTAPGPTPARASVEATTTPQAAARAAASVSGEVVVSEDLRARMRPGDTLFVFARAAEGLRVPLAVQKLAVGEGGRYGYTLDDGMAMGPNLRISAYPRIVVSARVSRSGEAQPRSGDLLGHSEAVAPGATGVKVIIDRVQP